MKILVVSSTHKEIEPFLSFLENPLQINENFFKKDFLNNEIFVCICGVGSYSMLYNLSKIMFLNCFDLVINIGIAGAYNKNIHLTEVVCVETEQIGDLGIDNDGFFTKIFETPLVDSNKEPFENGILVNTNKMLFDVLSNLRRVNGLSLNTVTGQDEVCLKLSKMFKADVESMEGAAFFYVCKMEKVPFVELRAISNFVGSRKESEWQIAEAIQSVNRELKIFILEFFKRDY